MEFLCFHDGLTPWWLTPHAKVFLISFPQTAAHSWAGKLPFLADIAEGMVMPTTLTTDADLAHWHALLDGAENEEAPESPDVPVSRTLRSRMH